MTRKSRLARLPWLRREPDDDHAQSIFLRGLSIGALIGAAIAGSAIWERRRSRRTTRVAPLPTQGDGPAS